jgi:hypothetical protein
VFIGNRAVTITSFPHGGVEGQHHVTVDLVYVCDLMVSEKSRSAASYTFAATFAWLYLVRGTNLAPAALICILEVEGDSQPSPPGSTPFMLLRKPWRQR